MNEEKDIPKGWEIKKLIDIAEIVRGVSYKGSDSEKEPREGYNPILRAGNINSSITYDDLTYVPEKYINKDQYLKPFDVLIATSSGSKNIVGKSAQINEERRIAFGAFCCVARPHSIEPKFLNFYFQSKIYKHFVKRTLRGANINNLRISEIRNLDIQIPPLPTQKKIVAILDKAEKLKGWRRDADELTDELLKSTFLEMFGDPVKNPMEWELMKFNKVGSLQRGKSKHRPRDAPELLGGPYPLIQTGEVSSSNGYIREYYQTYSEIGLNQSKMWPAGTLCITIAANIAKTGILTFNACFPDSIVGFTPYENATTEYVQYWLSFLQKTLEDAAPESAQKNINLKILSNLNIPIPPIELQTKFTEVVHHVIKVKEHQTQSSQQIEDLFNALMQQAFRGELS